MSRYHRRPGTVLRSTLQRLTTEYGLDIVLLALADQAAKLPDQTRSSMPAQSRAHAKIEEELVSLVERRFASPILGGVR